MRHVIASCLLVAALTLAAASPAAARGRRNSGRIGIGVGAGTLATGLSAKVFLGDGMSAQGNVGWWRGPWYCSGNNNCYGGGSSLAVSGDLLLEMPRILWNNEITLAWAIGAGAGVGVIDAGTNSLGVGVTGVVGLEIIGNKIPVELVIEYRPGVYVLPGFGLDLINATAHLRYYF